MAPPRPIVRVRSEASRPPCTPRLAVPRRGTATSREKHDEAADSRNDTRRVGPMVWTNSFLQPAAT